MRSTRTPVLLIAALAVFGPGSVFAQTPNRDAAMVARKAGAFAKAARLYRADFEHNARDAEALALSGLMLQWAQRYAESVEAFETALKLDPTMQWAKMERAIALSGAGREDESRAVFAELLKVASDPRLIRLAMANSDLGGRRPFAARAGFEGMVYKNPRDIEALLGVGRTFWVIDQNQVAREWFERAAGADRTRPDGELELAKLEMGADPAGALKRLSEIERRFPGTPQIASVRRELRQFHGPQASFWTERLDDIVGTRDKTEASLQFRAGRAEIKVLGQRVEARAESLSDLRLETGDVTATLGLGQGRNLTAHGGFDGSMKTPTGTIDSRAFGGVAYEFGRGGRSLMGRIGYESTPFRDNILGIRSGYVNKLASGSLEHERGWRRFGLRANGGKTEGLRDEADRMSVLAEARNRWLIGGVFPLQLTYNIMFQRASRPLPEVYLAQRYVGNTLIVGTIAPLGKITFVAAGVFSYGMVKGRVTDSWISDPAVTGVLSVELRLSPKVSLQGYGSKGKGGLDKPQGYVTTVTGFRLNLTPMR